VSYLHELVAYFHQLIAVFDKLIQVAYIAYHFLSPFYPCNLN